MSRTSKNGAFDVSVTLENIEIRKEDSVITFSPAEAEAIKHLLSIAISLGPGAAGRSYIQGSPFRILFDNEGKDLTVIRKEMSQGQGLKLTINEADRVAETVSIALDMYRDEQRLRPEPPQSGCQGCL